MEQVVGLIVALVVMLVGVAGSILPGLPGAPLILGAAVGHRLYFGDASAGTLVLVLMGCLALASAGLDYIASAMGAKKFGATWRGILGAAVGAVVGLVFGPIGLLTGPFLLAVALEALGGRSIEEAGRAGAGAFIGLLVGAVGKVACSLSMIGLFLFDVLVR